MNWWGRGLICPPLSSWDRGLLRTITQALSLILHLVSGPRWPSLSVLRLSSLRAPLPHLPYPFVDTGLPLHDLLRHREALCARGRVQHSDSWAPSGLTANPPGRVTRAFLTPCLRIGWRGRPPGDAVLGLTKLAIMYLSS